MIFARVLAALYSCGFILAFLMNVSLGNITLGLTLARSLLWPLWIAGFIQGAPLTMD